MTKGPADTTASADTYSYRPSPLAAFREFKLTDTGVNWSSGGMSGHVQFHKISRVRLSYRPVNMQSRRFVTELWTQDAPKLKIVSTSWKSLAEHERLDGSYLAFIRELHRRLSGTSMSTRFERGSGPLIYWLRLLAVVGVLLALAGLIVRAFQNDIIDGAVLVIGFLVLFTWQSGNFFWRNRPGKYRVDALPADVLPPQ